MTEEPIGAFVKTSLVDFPSHVASVVFLHGCNLRCPYCYNKELVTGTKKDYEAVSFSDIKAHLEKRKNLLKGLVLSGGEALLSPALENLILLAKDLGLKVKLDTNGTLPDKLKQLLTDEKLKPDFIALDVKTSPNRYIELTKEGWINPQALASNSQDAPQDSMGVAHGMQDAMHNTQDALGSQNATLNPEATALTRSILESIALVYALPAECREFRTVLVPHLVTKADILRIAELLPEDASWQFAPFRNENCINDEYNKLSPYLDSQIKELVSLAQTKIPGARLR